MTAEQSQRFDKLESMLAALDQSMDPSATAETLGKDNYLRQVRRDDHTVSLRACAAAIFSSASTAAGRSTSGETALINDAPAFEFIGESAAPCARWDARRIYHRLRVWRAVGSAEENPDARLASRHTCHRGRIGHAFCG